MPKVNSLIDPTRTSNFNPESTRSESRKKVRYTIRSGISFLIALGVWLCIASISTPAWTQESVPEFQRRRGLIQKFGSKSDLITFETDGLKLKPEFDVDRRSNQGKLQTIQQAVGGYSSGSSSSGNSWSATAEGEDIAIKCGYGPRHDEEMSGNQTLWLKVTDRGGNSESHVKVSVKKSGTISIDYLANRGISFFRFRQLDSGKVYCQDLNDDYAFVGNANSFDEFCRTYPTYARKRVEPIFKYLGMGVIPTRYADTVAKKVINDMQPVSDTRRKEFRQAIDGLNAGSFSEREEASKSLKKNFEEWKDLIQAAISDEEFSVETRTRLKKIFKTSVSEEEVGDLEIAQKGGLQEDASYLIWLLESAKAKRLEISDDATKQIVSKIESLTGENHGNDLEKWQAWLDKKANRTVEAPKPTITDAEILAVKGVLEDNSKHIGRLIKLNLEKGKLKLDKSHWASSFGGKSIKQLSEEARKKVSELKLPSSWLKEGGDYAVETTSFAQVLFEKMKIENPQQELHIYRSYQNGPVSSFNREMRGVKLTASLNTHKIQTNRRRGGFGGLGGVPKQEFFELNIAEKTGKYKRVFQFLESKEGEVLLSIDFPSTDAMIRIIQTEPADKEAKNGCVVFDIRGPVVKRFVSASFAEFQENEKEYFDKLIAPILKKLNIKIETEADSSEESEE